MSDVSPARIQAARALIDPAFLDTPQFSDLRLSGALGREVVAKIETLNPIGSFKARGMSALSHQLDPTATWVCSTAGNFGQALAYMGRARGARVEIFVAPAVPEIKRVRMRALGATVEVADHAEATARDHAAADASRVLVVDGHDPAMAEGNGTIATELTAAGPFDTVIVQIGDGALIAGVACWLRHISPETEIIGVCAAGAPAIARSVAAGRAVTDPGDGTIATAMAITEPVPESVARLVELVDEIVLVSEEELRAGMSLIADTLGLLVEPAGAAGVAALLGPARDLAGDRAAVILTGSGAGM